MTGKQTPRDGLSLSQELVEHIKFDLDQIGTDMLAVVNIIDEMAANGTLDHLGAAVELFAKRSGALTDGIIKNLSGVQIKGDIHKWFDIPSPGNEGEQSTATA